MNNLSYVQKTGHGILKAIEKELSGDYKDAVATVGRCTKINDLLNSKNPGRQKFHIFF